MQKAKQKIRLRVLAGMLALWMIFMVAFCLWQVNATRNELLTEVDQHMSHLKNGINEIYLIQWDEKPDSGLIFEVEPIDDVRARITQFLTRNKSFGEVELACYDENYELLGSSGAYLVLSYEVPSKSEYRVFGQSHYGIVDIDNVLPTEAAETVKGYLSYAPEELSGELGMLNEYSIVLVGFWSDGVKIVPKMIYVLEARVTEETRAEGYSAPMFDENGIMTDPGNMEIVWTYENVPDEAVIENMTFISDSVQEWGIFGGSIDKTYPELMERVQDEYEFRRVRRDGLEGGVQNENYGEMAATGFFTVDYYGYWYDYTVTYADLASESALYNGEGTSVGPTLVASGRVYPLKECAGTLMAVGAGSLLLFLMVAAILVWQLTRVYEKQAELEAQRRRTTNAMAHDLKTPMAAIVGYVENLLENTRPDKQEKYLRAICTQVGRMNETVGGMLELSRLEAEADKLNLTEFSLRELCREVAEDSLGDEVRFLLQGDGGIEADRAMMRRVLENFLSNARKHTAPGGIIEITVEQGKCTVFNPGEPIPQELLPRLWEAYYQADPARSQGGNGLGLSIVREILFRHGFTWGAENREGGVAFWFAY